MVDATITYSETKVNRAEQERYAKLESNQKRTCSQLFFNTQTHPYTPTRTNIKIHPTT